MVLTSLSGMRCLLVLCDIVRLFLQAKNELGGEGSSQVLKKAIVSPSSREGSVIGS
jgi:hypothetical protein